MLLTVIFAILIIAVVYKYTNESERLNDKAEDARIRELTLSQVDSMDGHTFEHYVSRLLVNEGYSKVEVTQGSSDYGVDILATKKDVRYAIQVKRQKAPVSRSAVSDAVAGMKYYSCNAAMVVTNNCNGQVNLETSLGTFSQFHFILYW